MKKLKVIYKLLFVEKQDESKTPPKIFANKQITVFNKSQFISCTDKFGGNDYNVLNRNCSFVYDYLFLVLISVDVDYL